MHMQAWSNLGISYYSSYLHMETLEDYANGCRLPHRLKASNLEVQTSMYAKMELKVKLE